MEKTYHLYHVCHNTKIVYVGMTSIPRRRWHSHCTISNKAPLSVAIQTYGKHEFAMEIVATGSKPAIKALEEQHILDHNTLMPNGYNRVVGYRLTAERKVKLSRSGVVLSQKSKDKIASTKTGKNTGEQNTQAKLTRQNVDHIRAMYTEGHKQRALSEKFGVSTATIRDIVKYRSWKD